MAARLPDWSSLPRELLGCVLKKFDSYHEYVLTSRVCTSWRDAVMDQKAWQELSGKQLPLLMVPNNNNGRRDKWNLYNFMEGQVYDLQLTLRYSERCCGSSQGWLATLGRDMAIALRNPFSGCCIRLPQIYCPLAALVTHKASSGGDYKWLIRKVVVSADPVSAPETCIVGVLYHCEEWLAFKRLQDGVWTYMAPKFTKTLRLSDILFYDGFMCSIGNRGELLHIDPDARSRFTMDGEKVVVPATFQNQAHRTYLVRSHSRGIIMIRRFRNRFLPNNLNLADRITYMEVFQLVKSGDGDAAWTEIETLDDEFIFVGDNQSMCFSCSDFPTRKPNRIYCVTDDVFGDLGVFNMEDGSFRKLLYTSDPSEPPSIFIMPELDSGVFQETYQVDFRVLFFALESMFDFD